MADPLCRGVCSRRHMRIKRYKTGMLPVASRTKCRKSCGSVPEADALLRDFHHKKHPPGVLLLCMENYLFPASHSSAFAADIRLMPSSV